MIYNQSHMRPSVESLKFTEMIGEKRNVRVPVKRLFRTSWSFQGQPAYLADDKISCTQMTSACR